MLCPKDAVGMLTMPLMACSGALSVVYLGTEPPIHAISYGDAKEVDYAAMDAEHKQLMTKIKQAGSAPAPTDTADKLIIKAQVRLCNQPLPILSIPFACCNICST